jgi:hypothetical protein
VVLPADSPFVLSEHAAHVLHERSISIEWVKAVLHSPARIEPDREDSALVHALRPIEEFGGRVLRVVYNPARKPPVIVTVFFDRSQKGRL